MEEPAQESLGGCQEEDDEDSVPHDGRREEVLGLGLVAGLERSRDVQEVDHKTWQLI